MRGTWLLLLLATVAAVLTGIYTHAHWPTASATQPAVADDDGTQEFDAGLRERIVGGQDHTWAAQPKVPPRLGKTMDEAHPKR